MAPPYGPDEPYSKLDMSTDKQPPLIRWLGRLAAAYLSPHWVPRAPRQRVQSRKDSKGNYIIGFHQARP